MAISKSQYPGTLKNTLCNNCNKVLNHLSAEDQEKHGRECLKQMKL
jgi:hypothetical protein